VSGQNRWKRKSRYYNKDREEARIVSTLKRKRRLARTAAIAGLLLIFLVAMLILVGMFSFVQQTP